VEIKVGRENRKECCAFKEPPFLFILTILSTLDLVFYPEDEASSFL
jgi:hypothetical protein